MRISITLPDGSDVKQILINKDLLKEENTDFEQIPFKLKELVRSIKDSSFESNCLVFDENKYYPVAISHHAGNNYFFLQLGEIPYSSSEDDTHLQEQHDKFIWAQNKFRAEVNNYRMIPRLLQGMCLVNEICLNRKF